MTKPLGRPTLSPATITPRQFLRLQDKLFAALLDPAWLAARVAEREAAIEPPPQAPVPKVMCEDMREFGHRPPSRSRQVLDAAAKLEEPIAPARLAEASGIPISTVHACIRQMVDQNIWPYALDMRNNKYTHRRKPCLAKPSS